MQPHYTNGATVPYIISPNTPERLIYFYHQIICCPTERNLLQEIKDLSLVTWTGLTEILISKYLPESEIMDKGHLIQQNQRPKPSTEAENVTNLSTKERENTSELLLQIFELTEKIILT